MEGVRGYDVFECVKPIKVTTLSIGKEMVMVDDPLHWIGMQELAKAAKGTVITAGLGLGLIAHALLENPAVTNITVVEKEPDVINLIRKYIPDSNKLTIIEGNIFDEISIVHDTVILDIWWGSRSLEIVHDMMSKYNVIKRSFPSSSVYIWGLKKPHINPAIHSEAAI